MRTESVELMAAAVCLAFFWQAAQDAATPSLQEQLQAQYHLSKMSHANGCTLTAPGTALRFQKPGVFAVPATSVVSCSSKYEGGKVSGGGICKAMVKPSGSFQAGDRVYVLKIDANPGKDRVSLGVASCEQGASWKGEVVFQFPKGYVDKASVTEIEDRIGELLALEEDSNAGGNEAPAQAASAPADQGEVRQPPVEQVSPRAVSIQPGQTQQEVEAALGPPEKKVNYGAKVIYLYKGLKITFQDGRVSQVE